MIFILWEGRQWRLKIGKGKILTNSKRGGNPSKEVWEDGCYTESPGFESRVRHARRAVHSWTHQWLRSKTDRREVPGSFLGRACRPSRSEFSVVFSETRVNTG